MLKTLAWMLSGGALLVAAMGGVLVVKQQVVHGAEHRSPVNGSPEGRLDHAMTLNRTGAWAQAAQEAEAVATLPGLSAETRCRALESAAYSRLRLHDEAAAERHLTTLKASWGALPDTHWIRREGRHLEAELTSPVDKTLRAAMHGNRTGDWTGARAAADDVLTMEETRPEQRGEAGYHAAWAALRLGGDQREARNEHRPAAESYVKVAEMAAIGLSRSHWLHTRLPALRKEIEQAGR